MLNVVCSQPLWQRFAGSAAAPNGMIIRGRIEYNDGVTNLVADRLEPLSSVFPGSGDVLPGRHRSRDFR